MLIFIYIYRKIFTPKKNFVRITILLIIYNNRKPKARIQKSTYMNGAWKIYPLTRTYKCV